MRGEAIYGEILGAGLKQVFFFLKRLILDSNGRESAYPVCVISTADIVILQLYNIGSIVTSSAILDT